MTTSRLMLTISALSLLLPRIGFGADQPAYLIEPPDILRVEVSGLPKKAKSIQGQYLVRPDGTVGLGDFGSVSVSGLTPDQARTAVAKHLAPYAKRKGQLEVRVEVSDYNSKFYYVIFADQIYRHPSRGGETVVETVLRVEGLAAAATKGSVWLTRVNGKSLEVDWRAITQQGKLATNYKLESGDRLCVGTSPPKSE